jgi:D-alanine-D-alanine ligase
MKTRIGVLFGGRSGEHEVSLCSAASVYEHLSGNDYEVIAIGIDRDGRWYPQRPAEVVQAAGFGRVFRLKKEGEWFINHFPQDNKLVLRETGSGDTVEVDCVFPVVHGTYCEDGTLQGLLDCVGVPYVGAGTMASAMGMDKDVTKRLLQQAGIPVVPWVTVTWQMWNNERARVKTSILQQIGLPCFAKPANAGSSVGISKIKREEDLELLLEEAFAYDNKILVEKAVDCREIECAVLGNENPKFPQPERLYQIRILFLRCEIYGCRRGQVVYSRQS